MLYRPVVRTLFAPAVFAAVVGLCLALIVASPAAAHDRLLETTPAKGETVSASPSDITLRYSANLLPTGAAVTLTNDAGDQTQLSELSVDADTVTAKVTEPLSGAYQVTWRVVSSDGHPISGEYDFTVDAPSPAATPTEAGATPAAADASGASADSASPAPAEDSDPVSGSADATLAAAPATDAGSTGGGSSTGFLVAGGVVLTILLVSTLAVLIVRKRMTVGEVPATR